MHSKKILITGATGLIGGHLVSKLKDDPSFSEIIILGRKEIPGLTSPSIKQFLTNFDDASALRSLIKADVVVCTIGTTIKKAGSKEKFKQIDYGIPLKIAQAASENNCPDFILVSAIGSNPDSKVFYNKIKGELERDLVRLKFRSIHILHPSLLLGTRNEKRYSEEYAQKILPVLNFLVPSKYRAIKAETVATRIREIALSDSAGVHHYEGDRLYPSK